MSNVDCLLRLVAASWNCTISKHGSQCLQSSNFEVDLDLVDRFAARGHSDAETIEEKCRVAIFVGGLADIGIVIVVVGDVPVASVKANSMRQNLES